MSCVWNCRVPTELDDLLQLNKETGWIPANIRPRVECLKPKQELHNRVLEHYDSMGTIPFVVVVLQAFICYVDSECISSASYIYEKLFEIPVFFNGAGKIHVKRCSVHFDCQFPNSTQSIEHPSMLQRIDRTKLGSPLFCES